MQMRLTKGNIYMIRILAISFLLLMARPMYDSGHTRQKETIDMFVFSGRTFFCGIDLGDDMKGGHGLETGLSYEIVKRFAHEKRCDVSIMVGGRNVNYIDSLKVGSIDMLITHLEDIEDTEGIIVSHNLTDCSVMAVRTGMESYIKEMNEWIDAYTSSEDFAGMKELFARQNDPIKLAGKGVRRQTISPYDTLFKQYAEELGWDWRMLAAVVYQESKFSINSMSYRGATGLMQVMPRTGTIYNIDNLFDPENNLKAGTSHLKRLQGLYRNNGMTHEERIRFTLAAYNAGEGRINDCRSLAKSQNLNPDIWEEVAKVIPMMNDDTILQNENVMLGKFKGTETLAYVENVMDLYSAICMICPEI